MVEALTNEQTPNIERLRAEVLICGGTGCHSSNSHEVVAAMQGEVARRGLADEVRVVPTGCRGFCSMGPVMMIYPEGILYCQVQASDVAEVVEETLLKGRTVARLAYEEPIEHKALPLLPRHPLLRQADPHRPAQLRPHRPGEHRRVHRPRRLRGAGQGADRDVARGRAARDEGLRAARPRRRRLPDRPEVGVRPARRRTSPSTSSATPTKATPARSWIARSWKATRTASWKGMTIAGYAIGAARRATSTAAPSTRWRSPA